MRGDFTQPATLHLPREFFKKLERRVIELFDSGDFEKEFDALTITVNLVLGMHRLNLYNDELWQRLETMLSWSLKNEHEKAVEEKRQIVMDKYELLKLIRALRERKVDDK